MYWVQFLVSFGAVFLKGFQQQNVVAGHYKSAGVMSFMMAAFEVATIAFVIEGGWASILPIGVGASIGIMLSMYLFRKIKENNNK